MEKIFFDTLVHKYVDKDNNTWVDVVKDENIGYYEDKDMEKFKEALDEYLKLLNDSTSTQEAIDAARAKVQKLYPAAHRY